jgi:catechol 2,3-dioxygenase-like lactoylglutathione lyase family enzyme
MSSITGFDHVAFQVQDVEAAYAFYRDALGAVAPHEDDFRRGKTPVLRLEIGGAVFNLHRAPSDSWLIAARAGPGGADICLRWNAPISDAIKRLNDAGVAIVEGPVPRRASNGEAGESVYFRDPDGNLLELLTLVRAAGPET